MDDLETLLLAALYYLVGVWDAFVHFVVNYRVDGVDFTLGYC